MINQSSIDILRLYHTKATGNVCGLDGDRWPCHVGIALEALDAAQARARDGEVAHAEQAKSASGLRQQVEARDREIAALREGLAWYADRVHWQDGESFEDEAGVPDRVWSDARCDAGRKARALLAHLDEGSTKSDWGDTLPDSALRESRKVCRSNPLQARYECMVPGCTLPGIHAHSITP